MSYHELLFGMMNMNASRAPTSPSRDQCLSYSVVEALYSHVELAMCGTLAMVVLTRSDMWCRQGPAYCCAHVCRCFFRRHSFVFAGMCVVLRISIENVASQIMFLAVDFNGCFPLALRVQEDAARSTRQPPCLHPCRTWPGI